MVDTIVSIIIALIIFGVLVTFHEFGHFIVAKACGVVVTEFSVGMGPRILSHVAKSGTRYSLKALPLGGSCAMLGEDEDVVEEGSFNSKSVWRRIAIVFAGPFFNFILAWVLAIIVIAICGAGEAYVGSISTDSPAYEAGLRVGDKIIKYNGSSGQLVKEIYMSDALFNPLDGSDITLTYERDGEKYTISYTPESETKYMMGIQYNATSEGQLVIGEVTRNSAIEEAGAEAGDIIKSVNGYEIKTGEDFIKYQEEHPIDGSQLDIVLERKGKEINIQLTPRSTTIYDNGFSYTSDMDGDGEVDKASNPLEVVKYSFVEVRYQIESVVKSLKLLVTGQVRTSEMSGPVGIVSAISETYTSSETEDLLTRVMSMVSFAIMLSANLGVMNLLPLPALDGGRLFIYLIEVIRRKPINRKYEGIYHFIGFCLLMILMVFLVINDIKKLI